MVNMLERLVFIDETSLRAKLVKTSGRAPAVRRLIGHAAFGHASSAKRCCTTLTMGDSHRESMRLDRWHEQAISRPLPHHELVQLYCFASQAWFTADLA